MQCVTMMTVVVVLLLIATLSVHVASACSCMPQHPQETYCNSDFVIVARVKKVNQKEESKVFKVKIKKTFKAATNKTAEALQTGLLWTAAEDAMCGASLALDTTYVITGHVIAGRARVSLCGYHQPWEKVTNKQRKGFRLLYKPTCNVCEIYRKSWWDDTMELEPNECVWDTNSYPGGLDMPDCQALYGICMKQREGHCAWTSDRMNQECAKKRRLLRKEQLEREP